MSRFIKTTSGYLNQDHILLIRFGLTKEDEGQDLIQMSDGRIVQTQIEDFDWLGPKYAVDEENRRRTLGAATEAENRSMPMGAAETAEDEGRRRAIIEDACNRAFGAAPEAENLRRTIPRPAAAEGQKETPAGEAGGGEGEDTVPRS
jgi:hypothetical protein